MEKVMISKKEPIAIGAPLLYDVTVYKSAKPLAAFPIVVAISIGKIGCGSGSVCKFVA